MERDNFQQRCFSYSYDSLTTKLALSVPCNGPRKGDVLEFWNSNFNLKRLEFNIMGNGKVNKKFKYLGNI